MYRINLKICSGDNYEDLIIDEEIYIEKEMLHCIKDKIKLDSNKEDNKFIECLHRVIEVLKENI